MCLWILSRGKKHSNKSNQTLFIDASRIYEDVDRTHRTLTEENTQEISKIYRNWLNESSAYKDISGFCKSVEKERIVAADYTLYPGEFIGVMEDKNDFKDKEISKKIAVTGMNNLEKKLASFEGLSREFCESINKELLNSGNVNMMKIRLEDALIESKEVLGDREEPEILTCTENAGIVLQRERFSKRVATEDTSKYKIVRKSDIVYNPYLLWAGAIDQCWNVDTGITSPAYVVLNIKPEFEPMIIGHILKSDYMKKWYWNISIGTHERRRTAPIDRFLKLEVEVPDFATQKRVSNLYREMMEQIKLLNEMQETILVTSTKLNEYLTGR